MKTKRYRPERMQTRGVPKQRHPLKASRPSLAPMQTRTQDDAPVVCTPLATERINVEVCADALNLVCSKASDEEGSYLIISIEVPVPFPMAYDAWVRFDDVPHFMRGRYLPETRDGSRMTWRVQTLFDQFAWQAKVCEQVPFELITWKSVLGAPHPGFGSVSFEPINQHRTWIMVQIGFDMGGVCRLLGDPLPSLSRSLEQSLTRFHEILAVQRLDEMAHLPC